MWTTADFWKIAEVQPKENFKADVVEFYKLVKHLSLLSGENKDLHQLSKQHPEEPQVFLSRTHSKSLKSFVESVQEGIWKKQDLLNVIEWKVTCFGN